MISGPQVLLEENFAGAAVDTAKWQVSNRPFENTGVGTFTVTQTGGELDITGSTDQEFWPGASIISKNAFVATKAAEARRTRDLMEAELEAVWRGDKTALDALNAVSAKQK